MKKPIRVEWVFGDNIVNGLLGSNAMAKVINLG